MELTDKELLNYILENGIISRDDVQKQIEMNERKKYLEAHNKDIWQGKDGKWYTYLPDENASNGRKLLKRSTRDSLNDGIVEYYKKLENEPLVETVFLEWINRKLEYCEIKKQSYDKYMNNFNRFFKNEVYHMSDKKIKYITTDDLEHFIKSIIVKCELTQKAYSDMRILINGIFKYAKKQGYTNISITQFMGDLELSRRAFSKTVKRKEDQIYYEDEIPKITEYLWKRYDIRSLGLLLVFETGIRIGELSALKFSDVHTIELKDGISKHYISIERTEIKIRDENNKWITPVSDYPKSDAGVRNVIITDKAMRTIKAIKRLNPFSEYMFAERGERIKSRAFDKKLQKVCKALDINYRSAHKIRRTYGTTLYDNNVNDSIICEMMGHADIETTRKYYYYSNKNDKAKIEQVANAINF
nr:MAG TPA: Integrase [Caudoviricetes sp.]